MGNNREEDLENEMENDMATGLEARMFRTDVRKHRSDKFLGAT